MTTKKIKRVQMKTTDGSTVWDNNPFKEIVQANAEAIEPDDVFNPDELFSSENGSDQNNVAKELFSTKMPKAKTDLSKSEISIIARLYHMSKRIYEPRGITLLKDVLDEFIVLRMSLDRKSRSEFVSAHQELQRQKQGGFMDRILGQGGGLQ